MRQNLIPSLPRSISTRVGRFWARHRSLFWTLHSLWALTIGLVVIMLARERYGFVPWVMVFLVLAWASTLFFGRRLAATARTETRPRVPGIRAEVTSYLTRTMYQETLFFLLPFYWYSTVVDSPNVAFTALLLALATFSCVDLVFDRWLRTRPIFGLVFFATVAFAAINLLLPMLVPIRPSISTPVAAVLAIGSSVPLAIRGAVINRWKKAVLALSGALFIGLVVGLPRLVPPVPLRLHNAVFASGIDRDTLVPLDTLGASVTPEALGGTLLVVVEVFAPSNLPASVRLDWERNGVRFRQSRNVDITAHSLGFHVWDGFHSRTGEVPVGHYKVILRTAGDRVFGSASIDVVEK